MKDESLPSGPIMFTSVMVGNTALWGHCKTCLNISTDSWAYIQLACISHWQQVYFSLRKANSKRRTNPPALVS